MKMWNKSNRWLFVLVFVMSNCEEITVTDISEDTVILRAPSEAYVSNEKKITFWWDYMEGASEYELVVTSPDFTNPDILHVDSVTVKNQLTIELPEGNFEWCVKGINYGYDTQYTCRTISVAL